MKEPKFKVGDIIYGLVTNYEFEPTTYGVVKTRIEALSDMEGFIEGTEQHYYLEGIYEDEPSDVPESNLSFDKQEIINKIVELLKNENN